MQIEFEDLLSQQLVNRFKFYCIDYLNRPHIKPERFMKKPFPMKSWRRPIILVNEKEEKDFRRLNSAIVSELTSILNLEAGKVKSEIPYHYIPEGFSGWQMAGGDGKAIELSFTENPGESYLELIVDGKVSRIMDRYVSLNVFPCSFPANVETLNSSRITLSYSY